jgi:hypothetical protein
VRHYLLPGAALALALAACASSKGGDCDPAVEVCGDAPDAGPPGPDAMPLKGFGEPCTDRSECESNICILVGTSGICTENCTGDDCPEDFGCLGVQDSVEPGQVDYVCVPTSNQICTPCTAHSECTVVGQDLCVPNALGDSFCARDCSTITCPAGYSCDVVDVDGDDYEQCIPNSGFCDCVAENQGLTEGCVIDTPPPFSTMCAGTRTCLGDGGWGACEPPSPVDDPDDAYTDSNCDGIDGDVTRGIFVGSAGANNPTCGTLVSMPCQSIAYGVVRAAQTSRPHVYVQTGTYNEVVPMVNGVSIYGGYNVTWQRASYSLAAHRVTITGGLDNGVGGDSEYLVIRAHDLIVPVTVDNLLLEAPDAVGAGKSSYAVHVDAATITLANVQVLAGNGANGANGANGLDAVTLSAAPGGGAGGNGDEFATACNNTSEGAGGGGGTNSCVSSPSSRNMSGGNGGQGGEMDTDCSCCDYDFDAQGGNGGGNAGYTNGSAGTPGGGSSPCANAGSGNPGYIQNGSAGSGGSGAAVSNGYWTGSAGGPGSTGQNGGGGGGGGGAGGCDDGEDAYGGGGGGGGSGGCAARGGGGAGGGGGASFGLFAVGNSTVSMTSCSIFRGNGGNGGAGGTGGRGQPGGAQGPRGQNPGAGLPGLGGRGGHGGHGGGGGGGAGGRSAGIAFTPGTTVTQDCTFSGGAAGSGGPGGVSAVAVQGTSEDDGFDGGSGSGGSLETVRTCASGSSC